MLVSLLKSQSYIYVQCQFKLIEICVESNVYSIHILLQLTKTGEMRIPFYPCGIHLSIHMDVYPCVMCPWIHIHIYVWICMAIIHVEVLWSYIRHCMRIVHAQMIYV